MVMTSMPQGLEPSRARLRIAMLGTRGLPATHGGVERAVQELSLQLAARGHEVTVFGRKGYCDPRWRAAGVRQVVLPAVRTKHLEAVTHTALATAYALARGRYDVLHFHATGPALFAALPRMLGVASVATIHGLDYRREKWGPFARLVLRVAARLAVTVPSKTIVVSRELQRQLRASYGAQTTYVTNGVEAAGEADPGIPVTGLEPRRFVLFLGRLVPEKQVHTLVKAFRRVETDFQLAIVGPAVHSSGYVAEVTRLAKSDPRIVFLGPRYGGEKAWLLANAALFVQPSSLEGLPIAVLEALAAECPVLVSDIPENVEATTIEGVCYGRTFETGSVEGLSEGIRQCLAQETSVRGNARLAVGEAYSWSAIARSTEGVYEDALGMAHSAGAAT